MNVCFYFPLLLLLPQQRLTFDDSDLGHLEDDAVSGLPPAFKVVPLEEDVLGDDWLGEGDVDDLPLGVEVNVLQHVAVVGLQLISALALGYRGLGEAGSEDDFLEPLHVLVTQAGDLQSGDQHGSAQMDLYPGLLEAGLAAVVPGCLGVIHDVVDGEGRDVVAPVNWRVPDIGIVISLQQPQRVGAGVEGIILQVSEVAVQVRIVRVTGPDLEKIFQL